jgi:hypothetical protein
LRCEAKPHQNKLLQNILYKTVAGPHHEVPSALPVKAAIQWDIAQLCSNVIMQHNMVLLSILGLPLAAGQPWATGYCIMTKGSRQIFICHIQFNFRWNFL